MIRKIIYHDARPSDSTIYVRFFDRFNDTLTDLFVEYFSKEERLSMIRTNKKHLGVLNFRNQNATIILDALYNLYDSSKVNDIIRVPLTPRSMDVYFNLPSYYFYYNTFFYEEQISEMLFVNGELRSIDGKEKYYYQR